MIFFKCFLLACAVIGGIIGIALFIEWLEYNAPDWVYDLLAFLIMAFVLAGAFYVIYWVKVTLK